jgi:hypothetical protein
MRATIQYQVATYRGQVELKCDDNDEDDYIIAKAKAIVKRQAGGSLPYGYESWKVIERDDQ